EVIRPLESSLEALVLDQRALAALRGLLGDAGTVSSTEEIAWAVRKLLEAAAAERPVVCVLDDVHWGEETFLDLVEQVAALARGVCGRNFGARDDPGAARCTARPARSS